MAVWIFDVDDVMEIQTPKLHRKGLQRPLLLQETTFMLFSVAASSLYRSNLLRR